jgi:hypothetical protein
MSAQRLAEPRFDADRVQDFLGIRYPEYTFGRPRAYLAEGSWRWLMDARRLGETTPCAKVRVPDDCPWAATWEWRG